MEDHCFSVAQWRPELKSKVSLCSELASYVLRGGKRALPEGSGAAAEMQPKGKGPIACRYARPSPCVCLSAGGTVVEAKGDEMTR